MSGKLFGKKPSKWWIFLKSDWFRNRSADIDDAFPVEKFDSRYRCSTSRWRIKSQSSEYNDVDQFLIVFTFIVLSQVLVTLELCSNFIADTGAQHLAEALEINQVAFNISWFVLILSIGCIITDTHSTKVVFESYRRYRRTASRWSIGSQSSKSSYIYDPDLLDILGIIIDTKHIGFVFQSHRRWRLSTFCR